MKNSRFQYGYRATSSAFHKAVGEILRNSTAFKGFQIYQEYPVNKVDPTWPTGREKYDWVIWTLNIVIECHGEQHYEPVMFGGITKEDADKRLKNQKVRDAYKKDAAIRCGFTYIAIPYWEKDKVSEEFLLKLIEENKNDATPTDNELGQDTKTSKRVDWKAKYAEAKQREEESGRAEQRRELARAKRAAQYRAAKRRYSGSGGGNGPTGEDE